MKNLIFLFLAACTFGCSATNTVTMSVEEPAVVQIPGYIERIGIINRSDTGDEPALMDKIDRVFSVEGVKLDEDGALQSISGLTEELKRTDWFEEIKTVEASQLDNPAFGVFPAPLSWDEIAAISDEHGLEGVFVLEFYDTDSNINYNTERVTLKGPLGIELPALEHHATVNTVIKTGWRIYDNNSRYILDEFVVTESFTTTGKGVNPAEAVSAITGRNELVKQVSNEIGQYYASRIIPYWIRVRRDYYVKGSDKLEQAKRRAQTGNWDGAAELWLDETESSNSKVAGRAYYNMAIIHEINGELDPAIEWARKSYEDYGDKRALNYVRILERRKESMDMLADGQ
ncbi:MAG: DUF6340 family protein [Balneolaceae bacterium]